MHFSYSICHIAGKYLYTADTLLRAPVSHPEAADVLEDHLTECFVNNVLASLPASPDHFIAIELPKEENPICQQLFTICREGWPTCQQQMPFDLQ